MLTDKQIQIELENVILRACKSTGISSEIYPVKVMGRVRRYASMKSGYYVFFQNFSNTSSAKKSKIEKYFRYTFRCIQFINREIPLYEIEKWTPICGSVDDGRVIYRSDSKKTDGMFQERMETAMKMVQLGM
jgi:hypothetical protein